MRFVLHKRKNTFNFCYNHLRGNRSSAICWTEEGPLVLSGYIKNSYVFSGATVEAFPTMKTKKE